MSSVTDPPDWVTRNKGVAQNAFAHAARDVPVTPTKERDSQALPPSPRPQKTYDMPGPDGDAARRNAAERNAIARSKTLQEKNPAEIEKTRSTQSNGQTKDITQQAKEADKSAIERAKKLELAKEFNHKANYKRHER